MPYVDVTDEMRRRMGLRFNPSRGSHLPVLMKAVSLTSGPILELGCGLYSTTPLHWACYAQKRRLVTYENNPEFFDFAKSYERDFHEVHCIDNWDGIDISGPWSVAFVDHEGCSRADVPRRGKELARLTHAEYVVCHDTEGRNDRKYGFAKAAPLFKHQFEYKDAFPHTSIFSNVHDVTNFVTNGTAKTLVKRDGWFKRYQEMPERRGKRKLADRSPGFDVQDFAGKTVLDLGCNIGQVSLYAADCGAQSVLGIEYDKAAFSTAMNLRNRRDSQTVRYRLDDLDNPLCWHHIEPHDTVLLLSLIETREVENPLGILSRACMKCKHVLYLEGHEGRHPIKYMNYLLDNTDFTQIEHVGTFEARDLFRCTRDVLDIDGFHRTLADGCQRYSRIGVVGNRKAGKTLLARGVDQPGFTILDDCDDLELIASCDKLILFDYRAAEYARDLDVLFHVLQPPERWEGFRKYAMRSPERGPSTALRRFYTVRAL